jgi:hypothetical protein
VFWSLTLAGFAGIAGTGMKKKYIHICLVFLEPRPCGLRWVSRDWNEKEIYTYLSKKLTVFKGKKCISKQHE